MALRLIFRRTKTINYRLFTGTTLHSPKQNPELINDISRILSDYRNPQHDIVSALSPFSSTITTDLVEQVLKRCNNLGFSAHRFFIWAKNLPDFTHSKNSYHIVIDILGRSKQFPLIWDFLYEMKESKSCEIDTCIFWSIFSAYSKANLPVDAIRAFNNMVDFGVNPGIDDLNQLLYVLCKRKHVREAQSFFDKVKSEFSPNVKTYSILVRGWGYVRESEDARKVFDEMLVRGCCVDVHAYNSILESLCKSGSVDEANKLFREMRSKGLEPDAFTYSIFIHAACNANDIHSAYRLLDRMKRYNLVPNVYTYNSIINKLCKNDKVEEAYELLDEMLERKVKPDVWSYNAILAFHCNRLEVNMATKVLSRMDTDSCDPDRHTYNMLLKMLIRVGRFDRVTSTWKKMEASGFHPSASTYAVMVHGLCRKKGKLEEACRYFEMMVDDGIPPYASTCELLRNKIVGLGFAEQVEILAEKMERSTSCTIQDLSVIMRGNRKNIKLTKEEDTEEESDF
ncbi:pentatricopeptide repeat-containing protein At1g52640, mitochondrial [Rutidosis leptorrhynchoides]|uniref:pentatricopeptide repeat-containing protein At1g52640, mitochondrial n=1 Tax=Rutidosis leptorrhynchoides TaxID=125765 RepID=UPI003A99AF36